MSSLGKPELTPILLTLASTPYTIDSFVQKKREILSENMFVLLFLINDK